MSKRPLGALDSVPSPPSAHRHRTSRRALSLHLTGRQWAAINPKSVKKALKKHARTLMKQVNLDWYDGYEKQSVTCLAWLGDVATYLQAVMDIGIGEAKAFKVCHHVLMLIGDSYRDLRANPMRVPLEDNFGDWDFQVGSGYLTLPWRSKEGGVRVCEGVGYGSANVLVHLCGFVWRCLLKVCATHIAEQQASKITTGSTGSNSKTETALADKCATGDNSSKTQTTVPHTPTVTTVTMQDVHVEVLDENHCLNVDETNKKLSEEDAVDEKWLFRAIKDAHDNGVQFDKASEEFDQLKNYDEEEDEDKDEDVDDGAIENLHLIPSTVQTVDSGSVGTRPPPDGTALRAYVEQRDKWTGLDKTIRTFNMRRAIDRRFSGPHHLRTNDFFIDDEDFDLTPSGTAEAEDEEDEGDSSDC